MSPVKRSADPSVLIAVGLILVAVYAIWHSVTATTVLFFVLVVPSIILHEVSHGVAALAFGDDTAKRAGRITLNPLKHIDPVGTLVLPALLALAQLGVFGYAKPVPVSPYRMRSPRNHALLVSLAGPATNLSLAGITVLVLRFLRPSSTPGHVADAVKLTGINSLDMTDRILFLLGFVNVTLAVFNALPIPPLDGSALVVRVLPARILPTYYAYSRYAMLVLLLLFLLKQNFLAAHLFGPAERAYAWLITG